MNTLLPSRFTQVMEPGRDLFREMREEMDDVLGRLSTRWGPDWLSEPRFVPSLDLSETDGTLEVRMDVPGMKPEEVEIEVSGNTLRVSGERKEEKEEKGRTFHRVERSRGTFVRSVRLPCAVREDQVLGEQRDGVLTITLPKCEEAKTHKIKVKPK
jgi:HSP20 family protein